MYSSGDPDGRLADINRRQAEAREAVRREAEARGRVESGRRWSFAAFRLWRLHVFIGFERVGR
ncbi:MAG: hypothetical protein M3494_11705 [Actinomycetota bacterium]|nr:hypothetical protein [Rubrobacter sp.]MDQ3508660.1 hypothetical protein [Actinomycetota bacterium]